MVWLTEIWFGSHNMNLNSKQIWFGSDNMNLNSKQTGRLACCSEDKKKAILAFT